MPGPIGRTPVRTASWSGVLLAALLGCTVHRPGRDAEPPRRLVRLGVTRVVESAPCAQRLRDAETGREYQLRGAAMRAEERVTGAPAAGAGVGTVGTYVPVGADGRLGALPLRVECTTLRVLGAA